MTTRFPLANVLKIAGRHAYPLELSVEEIVPAVRRQGYLTKEQLFILCRWKSPRSAGRVQNNPAPFVEEITRFALSAHDERARIEALTLLDDVEYPTASCILHWFHQDPYPIMDTRALWSLGLEKTGVYDFTFWCDYFLKWRQLLTRARKACHNENLTARDLDKALWQYSCEEQPENTLA
jgi:hypothetical protein